MSVALVKVTRGPLLESLHRGDLVVADGAGRVRAWAGRPASVTYLRSSAKPLQTLQVILSGAAGRFGFTPAELAIMCASHYGEDFHLEVVRSILHKVGRTEEDLRCGDAVSLSPSIALSHARQGRGPAPILSDCSGKHAGMLAVCVHRGWPLDSYMMPEHPLQVENRRLLAELGGVAPESIVTGVDGCSVPVFAMPLQSMARAYARLATPGGLPAPLAHACAAVAEAMTAHPEMVAGTDGFCTELMRLTSGKLVAKLGAEGVYGVGVRGADLGLALKIEDGGLRALPPVVIATLERLGLLTPQECAGLAGFKRKPVSNDVGWVVGEICPVFRLRRP